MPRPRVSQCDSMFKVVNANKDDCTVFMLHNLKLRSERRKVSSNKHKFNQLCNGQAKCKLRRAYTTNEVMYRRVRWAGGIVVTCVTCLRFWDGFKDHHTNELCRFKQTIRSRKIRSQCQKLGCVLYMVIQKFYKNLAKVRVRIIHGGVLYTETYGSRLKYGW